MKNLGSLLTKNIKKDYVASTVIIYFNEDDLNKFTYLHKSIRENTKFIKIGSHKKNNFDKIHRSKLGFNKFEELFFSWDSEKKDNKANFMVKSARKFFSDNSSRINQILKDADVAIIVYKDKFLDNLSYVSELSRRCAKNSVFTFHFLVECIAISKDARKMKSVNLKFAKSKKQPIVKIEESKIIKIYELATLENRTKYSAKFINSLVESFLVPFLEPKLNPRYFSILKKSFYINSEFFSNPIIPTIGYSDSKQNWIDNALISALTNEMFQSSHKSAKTFLVVLKASYLTNKMIAKIDSVLKLITNKKVNIIFGKYVGDFVLDVYAQICIFAIGVNETQHITETANTKDELLKIITKIEESKLIEKSIETKTVLSDLASK